MSTTPNDAAQTLDRLQRENRRLRTALVAVVSAGLGAAAMGLASDQPSSTRGTDPIGVTTDGTYIYVLLESGAMRRMQIEARERVNLARPDYYHNNDPQNWNRFVEPW